MEAEEDEPDACLQSQLLAVKHCLEAAKRKEQEGKPTVAYSVVADHTRSIRSVTVGLPGARNDKSICQYDRTIQEDMYSLV